MPTWQRESISFEGDALYMMDQLPFVNNLAFNIKIDGYALIFFSLHRYPKWVSDLQNSSSKVAHLKSKHLHSRFNQSHFLSFTLLQVKKYILRMLHWWLFSLKNFLFRKKSFGILEDKISLWYVNCNLFYKLYESKWKF